MAQKAVIIPMVVIALVAARAADNASGSADSLDHSGGVGGERGGGSTPGMIGSFGVVEAGAAGDVIDANAAGEDGSGDDGAWLDRTATRMSRGSPRAQGLSRASRLSAWQRWQRERPPGRHGRGGHGRGGHGRRGYGRGGRGRGGQRRQWHWRPAGRGRQSKFPTLSLSSSSSSQSRFTALLVRFVGGGEGGEGAVGAERTCVVGIDGAHAP